MRLGYRDGAAWVVVTCRDGDCIEGFWGGGHRGRWGGGGRKGDLISDVGIMMRGCKTEEILGQLFLILKFHTFRRC